MLVASGRFVVWSQEFSVIGYQRSAIRNLGKRSATCCQLPGTLEIDGADSLLTHYVSVKGLAGQARSTLGVQ